MTGALTEGGPPGSDAARSGAGPADAVRARGRRVVLGVAAVFFIPVALAFALYYGSAWRPSGRTNHGTLYEPVRPLPAAQGIFQGKWSLVYVAGLCDAPCRHALHTMQQTRLMLLNDRDRVQRVLVILDPQVDAAALSREEPGLRLFEARPPLAAPLVAAFAPDARVPAIYVVDPLGNLVLRFDARANPKGLLADLQKLLRLSHVG